MYFGVLIAFLFGANPSIAQSTYSEFISEDSIELKVELALNLWSNYSRNSIDSLKIISNILSSNPNLGDFGKGISLRSLGGYSIRSGDIEEGVEFLKDALYYFVETNADDQVSEVYNDLGNAYNLTGDYRTAAKYYSASLIQGKRASDVTASYNGMIGLGKVFYAIGDEELGMKLISIFLSKSLRDAKFESAANACAYMGMVYMSDDEPDLMKAYFKRSLIYAEDSESLSIISNAKNNQAILYFTEGKIDSALILFEDALELRVTYGQNKSIIESYFNLGGYYLETEDYELSEEYFNESLRLAEENNFLPDHLDALLSLEELYLLQKMDGDERLSGLRVEIKRVGDLIKKNSKIDESIYKIAMTFEEPAKELFETKPKSLLTMTSMGAVALILIILVFLRIDRSLI